MSQLLQGRYRREAVLGEWDAATTTLAMDTSTGELCIVKTLRLPREKAAELVKLLKREARAYAQISHPRIPRLIDAFALEEAGLTSFHLVLEHVPGRDLARVVREDGPYPEERALPLLRALAELLDRFHGHAPPLTHRAVKPQNVVIAEAGEPHLVDFGSWSGAMRRLLGPEGQIAPSDARGYSAPEQLAGRPVAASDVYALGATLLFSLTGKDPAELAAAGAWAAAAKLPVSRRLRRVLERMLEPSLDARYTSARELRKALEEPKPGARLGQWRVLAGGAAALALATVVLARRPAPAPRVGPAIVAEAAPEPVPASRQPSPQAVTAEPEPQAAPPPATAQPEALSLPAPSPSQGPQKVTAERPVPLDESLPAVQPRYGVLSVDVYRDFKYVASGWPGGLSVGQTDASALDTRPQERLLAEPPYGSRSPLYGYITLGSGPDPRISFVLDELERRNWVMWIDKNNNQDLTDDGPPLANQGSGPHFAATVSLFVEFDTRDSGVVRRPYQLWLWVNDWKNAPAGQPPYAARFYATCHYAGRVALGNEVFEAAAFEQRGHDGLLADDGLWIDLDRDGKFAAPQEHFTDGEEVRTGRELVRLRLAQR